MLVQQSHIRHAWETKAQKLRSKEETSERSSFSVLFGVRHESAPRDSLCQHCYEIQRRGSKCSTANDDDSLRNMTSILIIDPLRNSFGSVFCKHPVASAFFHAVLMVEVVVVVILHPFPIHLTASRRTLGRHISRASMRPYCRALRDTFLVHLQD